MSQVFSLLESFFIVVCHIPYSSLSHHGLAFNYLLNIIYLSFSTLHLLPAAVPMPSTFYCLPTFDRLPTFYRPSTFDRLPTFYRPSTFDRLPTFYCLPTFYRPPTSYMLPSPYPYVFHYFNIHFSFPYRTYLHLTHMHIRTRADMYKNITPDYYGYRDDDDGVLMEKEKIQEVSYFLNVLYVLFYLHFYFLLQFLLLKSCYHYFYHSFFQVFNIFCLHLFFFSN
jgi:Isy1-like splicing family